MGVVGVRGGGAGTLFEGPGPELLLVAYHHDLPTHPSPATRTHCCQQRTRRPAAIAGGPGGGMSTRICMHACKDKHRHYTKPIYERPRPAKQSAISPALGETAAALGMRQIEYAQEVGFWILAAATL
jgi:hypothetical protein